MPRKYYLRNRPPCIGTHPAGAISQQVWWPAQQVGSDQDSLWYDVLGWVEYDEPLTLDQMWKYELWPHDKTEQCAYWWFSTSNRDRELAEDYAKDYYHCIKGYRHEPGAEPLRDDEAVAYDYFIVKNVDIEAVCKLLREG